jgi:HSP20 family protein
MEELAQLRDDMDRFLQSPFGGFAEPGFFNEWAPAIDLHADKDNVFVRAELPGMKKENIDVSLHENRLTISGERKSETKTEGETHRTERFYGRFSRTVTLPFPVQGEQVKASYKDGILTVTLPKAEEARPKQIEVNVK